MMMKKYQERLQFIQKLKLSVKQQKSNHKRNDRFVLNEQLITKINVNIENIDNPKKIAKYDDIVNNKGI